MKKYPNYEETKSQVDKKQLEFWFFTEKLTCKQVMEKYNYKDRIIAQLAKEYGIKIGRPRNSKLKLQSPENIKLICTLYENGDSASTISKKLNCSSGLIKKILHNNNVKMRDRHDLICYESRRLKEAKPTGNSSNGYYYMNNVCHNKRLHRYVMEQHLGRKLLETEHVHHIDLNKENNDISNLFLFPSNRSHLLYHGYIKKFIYISPQEFLDNFQEKITWLYSYDTLYDLYINKRMSCNEIGKTYAEIASRQSIANTLKSFGIYNVREPTINQYNQQD